MLASWVSYHFPFIVLVCLLSYQSSIFQHRYNLHPQKPIGQSPAINLKMLLAYLSPRNTQLNAKPCGILIFIIPSGHYYFLENLKNKWRQIVLLTFGYYIPNFKRIFYVVFVGYHNGIFFLSKPNIQQSE